MGKIGFEGRYDYGAIGPVTTFASRLCDAGGSGQIIIAQRVHAAVQDLVDTEPADDLLPAGSLKPVSTFRVLRTRSQTAAAQLPSADRPMPSKIGRSSDV